ncbi:hypothetical protein L211DRAFT_778588 [Terfezia boudieri ATCC MYA-4762]|uniref:Disintegrin and metalloproteinase domain-containing protein B n=1 Tax=Terfezia boudieri ATCC MYA-4762 TaxID=1051890 RepID=A0A3N4LYV2_9PEZI|nr:hypothetical protein L211DRAFT_778588 [Terfezia boudieri ATCC MYA-4762]
MWSIHRLSCLLVICTTLQVLLLGSSVEGHSQQRSVPLSYISLVENAQIRTPSQRIHHNSEFDITFTLHRGKQEVRLSLEPNHDIVPSGAKVEYLGEDGKVARTEEIQRHEVRVFKGQSWVRDGSGQGWTHAGWARIVVQRDGVDPLFTGAFLLNSDAHHVQLKSWYMKTKGPMDPELETSGDDFMVVWKDSDVKSNLGKQAVLGPRELEEGVQCHANNLTFNQMDNPIHQQSLLDAPSNKRDGLFGSFGMMDLFNRALEKRTSLDTGTIGNTGGLNLKSTIGQTAGCPTTKQMALVGVAADCTYIAEFDSQETARSHIITQFNSASAVFESTFNITLGIKSLVIPAGEGTCPGTAPSTAAWNLPCTNSATVNDRLNLFSSWRGQADRTADGNAFWTLLTNCKTGSAVGLAWVGMLCKTTADQGTDGQVISGANVVAKTPTEWKVIAHEIGHTMGAVHDCTSGQCAQNMQDTSQCCPLSAYTCNANNQFLMNPSTSDQIDKFSACTIGNICGAFLTRSVSKLCLTDNRNVSIITENKCGNGIVEPGEDCDCGGTEGCAENTCCNATTCKFSDNSVCDDSNDDCCSKCQFASSSHVCRPSTGECDPEEKCTGSQASCPKDVINEDGTACSSGLTCMSGQCTSRDLQCKTIMGVEYGNNDTSSCNSQGCQVQCASPELGSGFCYEMQQNFLDGTPCEGDGRCQSGICKGSTTLGAIKEWINNNKPLVIGISAGVGSLIAICLLICICKACWRRRRVKKMPPPVMALPPPPYPPPPDHYGNYGGQHGAYNTLGSTERQFPQQNQYPQRHASVRYG